MKALKRRQDGMGRKWWKKNPPHIGTSEEDVKDTDVANHARKCNG
jgi:hypothetical protein